MAYSIILVSHVDLAHPPLLPGLVDEVAQGLAPGGRLLVLNEPTRGVDIGAKAEIHQLVNELTASGVAVLMVSSDLPELIGMSDRIVVLSQGEVVGRLAGKDRTEENVIACATTDTRIGVDA